MSSLQGQGKDKTARKSTSSDGKEQGEQGFGETGGSITMDGSIPQMALHWLNGAEHQSRACHQPFSSGWTPCVCGLHALREQLKKCLSENGPKSDAVLGVSSERKEGDALCENSGSLRSSAAPVVQPDSVAANPSPSPSEANAQAMEETCEHCGRETIERFVSGWGDGLLCWGCFNAHENGSDYAERRKCFPSTIKEQPEA